MTTAPSFVTMRSWPRSKCAINISTDAVRLARLSCVLLSRQTHTRAASRHWVSPRQGTDVLRVFPAVKAPQNNDCRWRRRNGVSLGQQAEVADPLGEKITVPWGILGDGKRRSSRWPLPPAAAGPGRKEAIERSINRSATFIRKN